MTTIFSIKRTYIITQHNYNRQLNYYRPSIVCALRTNRLTVIIKVRCSTVVAISEEDTASWDSQLLQWPKLSWVFCSSDRFSDRCMEALGQSLRLLGLRIN